MIEQIMYFALGALIATLAALLVLPAVWHRAVRLTTKRVEAAVPVSMFEVQADKDQQRAFFALNQRRLELQGDTLREKLVAQATTIEHQRQQVVELERSKAELEAKLRRLEGLNAEEAVLVGELQDQVSDRTTATQQLDAALASAKAQHARLAAEVERLTTALAARDARLAPLEAGTETGVGDAALRMALAELAAKIVVLTAQVEGQMERQPAGPAGRVAEGRTSPIVDLVAKSSDPHSLAGRIRALLEQRRPEAAE